MTKIEKLEKLLAEATAFTMSRDKEVEFPDIMYSNGYTAFRPGSKYTTISDADLICALRNSASAMIEIVKAAKNLRTDCGELEEALRKFEEST